MPTPRALRLLPACKKSTLAFSVMPDGLVHESEEKLRAHFLHTGTRQRLDYLAIDNVHFDLSTYLSTGVDATGDAGDTSPPIFGQPGTTYLRSTAKFVKFLLSHAKRRGS